MFNSDSGFRSIFYNSHIVMILIDPAIGKIVDANQAAVSFYGWDIEQLKARSIDDINVLSAEDTRKNLCKASSGSECHFFLRHRLADGRIREIEAFCGPVEVAGRQLLYSINFDITDRCKFELEFSLNQERLKSIVKILQIKSENVQEILDSALNEAIVLTRSSIGYILSYSEETQEFVLTSWSRWVMHGCAIDNPPTVFQLDQTGYWGEAVRQRGPIIVNDFAAPDPLKKGYPPGHIAVEKFLTVPIFFNDRIVAVIGVANKPQDYDQTDSLQLSLLMDAIWKSVENIESQKKVAHLNRVLRGVCEVNRLIARATEPQTLAEDTCRILAETRGFAGAMVILTDNRGGCKGIAVSGLHQQFTGFTRQVLAGNLPNCCVEAMQSRDVLLIKDRKIICEDCQIAEPCKDRTSLISAMRFNDELYGFVMVVLPRNHAESSDESFLLANLAEDMALALHNISMRTAKQLAEKDRDSLQTQLIQSQKIEAIGQLAGGVAHDFNNLLSVILGYGEIIMQDINSDSVFFEPISEINAAAERARNLTRQLLAFSRKQVFEVKLVAVNAIVKGFEKFLRRIIGERIRLELKLCHEEALIKADISQLEQAMMNLSINARDAMPGGGVLTIETSIHYFDEAYVSEKIGVKPGNYVMLAFSDTGVGMTKETMNRMFEPFFTTKDADKGTGLGLSTAYGIVRQHDGHIWADSEPGRGTTFKIFMPLTCGMEEPAESLVEPLVQSDSATVLVVEDDLLVRRLACKILARQGYRVLEAENYDTAVEIARLFTGRIDLLLSDVIMPGKEGPEVFKAISELCPEVKVLYMSGYSPTQISQMCNIKNIETFVQKPISVSALLGKVSQLLRQKKKTQGS